MNTKELMQKFIGAHFGQFDFTTENNAWGEPKFKHSHIRARFDGWLLGREENVGRIGELQSSNMAVLEENRKLKDDILERDEAAREIQAQLHEILEDIKSVTCNPDGDVATEGSDADRAILQNALFALNRVFTTNDESEGA